MTINFTTLFTRIGKAVKVAKDLDDTAAASLVTSYRAFEEELDSEQHDFQQDVLGQSELALTQSLSTISGIIDSLISTRVSNLIIETVDADVPLVRKNITVALEELIDQMKENGESLDKSTITTSIDYGESLSSSSGTGDNYGNGVFVVCEKRGDGRVNEFIYAETIRCECISTGSSGTATWRVEGEPSESLTNPRWPTGSASQITITSNTAGRSNLVPNGNLESEDTYSPYLPEYWILVAGTLGTHVKITDTEEQTVTINGTPTGGSYVLHFTDKAGRQHSTVPLTYNASATAVQSALSDLPYLGEVEVTSTGTSPDLTHTIEMIGVPNPSQISYTSSLTGGTPTITTATSVAGSAFTVRGSRCLEFIGDGSTNTEIQVSVDLAEVNCYILNFWAAVDVVPAAGTLDVSLVDGDSGAVIDDDQGAANTLTIDLTTLSAVHSAHNLCIHTPRVTPPRIYLRFKLSTPLSSGSSLFIDEVCLVRATELYASGLYVAAFAGPNDFEEEDFVTITVVNAREGELHSWINRLLNLEAKRLMLPTASVATLTDSLIA